VEGGRGTAVQAQTRLAEARDECGHTARNNRRSRDLFVCRLCGLSLHADLNGARNIAAKYRAEGGTSAFGGLPVNQPTGSDPTLRRSG
jgi:putative transposase